MSPHHTASLDVNPVVGTPLLCMALRVCEEAEETGSVALLKQHHVQFCLFDPSEQNAPTHTNAIRHF